jgi:hypothetical protein
MAISAHVGEVHDTPETRASDHHRLFAQRSIVSICVRVFDREAFAAAKRAPEKRENNTRKQAIRTNVDGTSGRLSLNAG